MAHLRVKLSQVLKEIKGRSGAIYVTQRGEPRAVLLSVDEYQALIDQLEYLDDSLEGVLARERRESGRETTRPWSVVKGELLGRGRLSP